MKEGRPITCERLGSGVDIDVAFWSDMSCPNLQGGIGKGKIVINPKFKLSNLRRVRFDANIRIDSKRTQTRS